MRFSIRSDLAIKPEDLWDAIVCPTEINGEFLPLLKMTFPQGLEDVTMGWKPGVTQFRSWILLGALIPVDYDNLVFEEVVPGAYFLERSSMFSQSLWEHRRELKACGGGTTLIDSVCFEPRITALAPAYRRVFEWLFRRRHRTLVRVYGKMGSHHGF